MNSLPLEPFELDAVRFDGLIAEADSRDLDLPDHLSHIPKIFSIDEPLPLTPNLVDSNR